MMSRKPPAPAPRGGVKKPMPISAPTPRGGINKPMPVGGVKKPMPISAPAPRPNVSRPMGMKKGGAAKSGGSYRKAADGVAHKGKTKGKMVKMRYGGEC